MTINRNFANIVTDNIFKREPMKILVCIKQIIGCYDSDGLTTNELWPVECNDVTCIMNRYDEHALEEALLLKEAIANVEIHALSVGPDRVTQVIGRALAKGADTGVHIRCNREPLTAMETAAMIVQYAEKEVFDLVFTGVMSEDLMQCQVGPLLSALLAIPCAVSVTALSVEEKEQVVTVQSELEGMMSEKVALPLPALITVQSGGNIPRYPSLSNIFRAKGKRIITIDGDDLPVPQHDLESLPLELPPVATKGIILTGNREEQAKYLLKALRERSLL